MSKSANLALIIAVIVICALTSASAALAQPRAGAVTLVSGDVHIERAGATLTATQGMTVNVGDRIVTGANGRITITLTDNSKLELDASTTLVIDAHAVSPTARTTKLSLFSGLVHSFVSYASAPAPNFEVHTPNAVASARGTQYDTGTDTNQRPEYKDCRRFTQVSVYEGTVEVVNPTNPSAGSVRIPAGYKTMVVCGLAPLTPTSLAAAAATTGTTAATTAAAVTSTTGLFVGGVVAAGVAGGVAAGVVAANSGGTTTPTPTPKKPKSKQE
jgi:ferric-dicitrate binding protein FerR (iron transport regulator)